MEGFTFFFTWDECQPHGEQDFSKLPCSLGVDLSRGDDFCAFTFLFPLMVDETGKYSRFGIDTRSYITRRTLDLLPGATRVKYEEFIAEGTLIIMEGAVLDMLEVYDDISAYWLEKEYDIRTMGFDVYNSKAFAERYERDWGPYGMEKVPQGARTESVPLGEMKILAASRDVIFYQKIMQYTMGHAVTWEDSNGNRKLIKRRNDEKIDNVSAWMDAYIAMKNNPDQFD